MRQLQLLVWSEWGRPAPDTASTNKGDLTMANDNNNTSNRGFASMDPEKQREIASKGGKAAHEKGTAHEFTSEEAREAGSKGGQASGGNFANDRQRASEAGRKGGENSHGGRNS
jgi:general stress protein YciG